ncbi:MAG: amino acid deaminase [Castellaniella sp.]|uniref:amino acid deaminase n=1 Tax=Castellaniella sp. TaxID=1955812 RepID=UPI001219DBEA|nr:amino acid deaminase [Castellaniella sp.]TAN27160.1 MAG: amino acid deaminase [Castellaniella sp.]
MYQDDIILLDHRFKGFPPAAAPCAPDRIAERGWNLFHDDLPFPLAVLDQAALDHNLRWMQAFAAERGVDIAPHGKTTMSPQIFRRQLDAGAWGLTFATIFQVGAGVRAGARRIIVANQVLADADLDGLAALLDAHPDLRVWFLVDSDAQVALIEDWAYRRHWDRPLDCLLEIGVPGQRTGCRTAAQALALATRIRGSLALKLGGIECYEGGLAHCDRAGDEASVAEFLGRVRAVAEQCDRQQLFEDETVILSAGGSAVFDVVAPALRLSLSHPVRGVLRSGCYVTHDHGFYAGMLRNVEARSGLDHSLRPALSVWTLVQSVPEPGLALLTCGKRDISFDLSLPQPIQYAPRSAVAAAVAPADWKVTALNDQHAYLRFDPVGRVPVVGDRVVLGISHPCTTFDKWRWMPLVDAQGQVTGAVTTEF